MYSPKRGEQTALGGFGNYRLVFSLLNGIGNVSGKWTAFLSIILAFMNILPIPALGWRTMAIFIVYEIIIGAPQNQARNSWNTHRWLVCCLFCLAY